MGDKVIIGLRDPRGKFQNSDLGLNLKGTETATVERTDHIRNLIRKGILVVKGKAPEPEKKTGKSTKEKEKSE